jgi:hypothetical protein
MTVLEASNTYVAECFVLGDVQLLTWDSFVVLNRGAPRIHKLARWTKSHFPDRLSCPL